MDIRTLNIDVRALMLKIHSIPEVYIAQKLEDCKLICKLLEKVLEIKGDIAEVGVWRGGSAALIAEVKGDKILHLFDTFEGMPYIMKGDTINGRMWKIGEGAYTDAMEHINRVMERYSNVFIYKGIFPLTGELVKDKKFCFVHIDVDIYKSTLDSLNFFYSRMSIGGIILMHDYIQCPNARKAMLEFLKDKPEKLIVIKDQCYFIKLGV